MQDKMSRRKTNKLSFGNLESRNFVNKTVPKVVKEDGSMITKKDIIKKIQSFYSNFNKHHRRDAKLNVKDILNKIQGPTYLLKKR